jgi:hypothetical protein
MPGHISILLLTFFLYSGVASAHIKSSEKCQELVKFVNQTEGAVSQDEYDQLINSIAGTSPEMQADVKSYINKLQASDPRLTPDEMDQDCNSKLNKMLGVKNPSKAELHNAAASVAVDACDAGEALVPLLSIDSTEPPVKKSSPSRGVCSESPLPDCGIGPVLFPEFLQLEAHPDLNKPGPRDEAYSSSECNCLADSISKREISKTKLISQSRKEYARIDNIIFEAAGKKFLNDFAAFYEDVRYYDEGRAWVLGKNENGVDSSILCSEPKDFQNAIKKECPDVSEIDREARTSSLLSLYENKFDARSSKFPNSFKNLLQDFESPDKSVIYSRKKLDEVRFGMNKAQADVLMANQMVTSLLKNKGLSQKLNESIANGKSPHEAVMLTLSHANKTDPLFLKKILKENSSPLLAELIENLNGSVGYPAFDIQNKVIFERALKLNPGFKSLLLDPSSFNKISKEIASDDFMNHAEKQGVLKSQFKERCQGIQKKLAEAVCTNPADLISKVSRKDLVSLLNEKDMIGDVLHDGIDMAICSANNNKVASDSAFAGLVFDTENRINWSDYHDIKNNKLENQNNIYSRAARKPEDPSLVKIAQTYDYQRVSSSVSTSSSKTSSSAYGQLDAFSMMKMTDVESLKKSSLPESASVENIKSANVSEESNQAPTAVEAALGKVSSNFQASAVANKAASTDNGMTAVPFQSTKFATEQSSKAQEMKPSQSELVKELSSAEPDKVKKLVSNISDSDAKELLKLREQARSDKNVISALNLEAEKARMTDLKSEYEELEKKLETLKKEKSSLSDRTQMVGESSGVSNKYVSAPSFQENSNVAYEPRATGGGQDGLNSGFEDMSSQAKSANMRNVATFSASAAPVRDVESKGDNKLMVISSQKSGSGSDDPSGELINYLAKNETDSEALRSLKESGLLYKVEVNENGKKEVKTKLIKYNELTPEAKLLVDRRLSILEITESQTLTELEKKVLLSKRAYSIQALRLELLSVSRH